VRIRYADPRWRRQLQACLAECLERGELAGHVVPGSVRVRLGVPGLSFTEWQAHAPGYTSIVVFGTVKV
jgi:hypothetical protein